MGLLILLFSFMPLRGYAGQLPGSILMQVSTGSSQGYTIKVRAIREDGAVLADLGSFSRALRLNNSFDGSRLQIDEFVSRPGSSCIIRPASSFMLVVPAGSDSGKRVIQLSTAPDVRQGRLYVPVEQACRMFSVWLDRDLVYDTVAGSIKATLWRSKSLVASTRSVGQLDASRTAAEPVPAFVPVERPQTGPTVIEDVQVETLANGCMVRLVASGNKSAISYLRPDEHGAAYLTIEKANGDMGRLTRNFGGGPIRSITPMQLDSGALQFTVVLNTEAFVLKSSTFQYDGKNNDYVLYIMSDVDVEAIHRAEKEMQNQQKLSRDVSKWKLDAIVIDAGHGGKDPGTHGTRGTKEKDVVMNIASDLGMFIKQKWPDVKVIYTRKDDNFIQLNERGRIANRFGGKLFVSIHCNSAPKNAVRGAEVYILGPHKTQAALDVAMLENSSITAEENYKESYKGFSDEHLIMSSMAQSAFATQSTELAQDVVRKLDRYRNENRLGVRQAGFMVLWTPSMPSILVETGYLSNPDEEKILRDREQQTKIAFGIFQGLQQFRSSYETRLTASGHVD